MATNSIRILLVEDNPATLSALAKLLQHDGYDVCVADGYQTAMDIARKAVIDLSICDIHLWDGDGCDLLRDLQELHPMRAIALTGYTLPEETEHYRDAGFDIVLQKPIRHSEVTSAIVQLTAPPPI